MKAIIYLGLVTLFATVHSAPFIDGGWGAKLGAKFAADLTKSANFVGGVVEAGGQKVDQAVSGGIAKIGEIKEQLEATIASIHESVKNWTAKTQTEAAKTGEAIEAAVYNDIANLKAAVAALAEKLKNSKAAAAFQQMNDYIKEIEEAIKAKKNEDLKAVMKKSEEFWKSIPAKITEGNKELENLLKSLKKFTDNILLSAKKALDDKLYLTVQKAIEKHDQALKVLDAKIKEKVGKAGTIVKDVATDAVTEVKEGAADLISVVDEFLDDEDAKAIKVALTEAVTWIKELEYAIADGTVKALDDLSAKSDALIKAILEPLSNVSKGREDLKTAFEKLINSLELVLSNLLKEVKKSLNADTVEPAAAADASLST